MENKKIIYFDMDGVLANFHGAFDREITPECEPEEIYKKGFYSNLEVNEGAKEAMERILNSDKFEVYIASKPASKSNYCAGEKFEWVSRHFPELKNKIFLTPNKNLLKGHLLVDDNPHKWNNFEGEVMNFNPHEPAKSWGKVLKRLGL